MQETIVTIGRERPSKRGLGVISVEMTKSDATEMLSVISRYQKYLAQRDIGHNKFSAGCVSVLGRGAFSTALDLHVRQFKGKHHLVLDGNLMAFLGTTAPLELEKLVRAVFSELTRTLRSALKDNAWRFPASVVQAVRERRVLFPRMVISRVSAPFKFPAPWVLHDCLIDLLEDLFAAKLPNNTTIAEACGCRFEAGDELDTALLTFFNLNDRYTNTENVLARLRLRKISSGPSPVTLCLDLELTAFVLQRLRLSSLEDWMGRKDSSLVTAEKVLNYFLRSCALPYMLNPPSPEEVLKKNPSAQAAISAKFDRWHKGEKTDPKVADSFFKKYQFDLNRSPEFHETVCYAFADHVDNTDHSISLDLEDDRITKKEYADLMRVVDSI